MSRPPRALGLARRAALPALALLLSGFSAAPERALPAVRRTPRRVALLVGIADYKNFTPDGRPGETDLEGPKADVELMKTVLRGRGFDGPDDVRVLRDAEASKAGLIAGFKWAAERADSPEDVVVIYYSGHGTFTPDDDGDEAKLNPGDVFDEALVPWDAPQHTTQRANRGGLLVDDEIAKLLELFHTKNVTIILDACYSGTATRGAEQDERARPRGPIAPATGQGSGGGGGLVDNAGYTLITAASSNEQAFERPVSYGDRGSVTQGVLTYALGNVLRSAGPTMRYDELMTRIRRETLQDKANQTPQLEGNTDALLFNDTKPVPARMFAEVATAGGRLTLDMGVVHGLRQGALLDVYPAGEMAFRDGRLGQVEVDSLELERAFVHPVGSVTTFPAEARAVVSRMPRGIEDVTVLPVAFTARAAAEKANVGVLPWLRPAAAGAGAALVDRDAGGALRVTVDGIPVKPDGPAPRTLEEACPLLERAMFAYALNRIRQTDPPPALRVALRVVKSDTMPDIPRAVDTVRVGDTVAVWALVQAPAGTVIYLTAATSGYLGNPILMWPNRRRAMAGAQVPFELNQWVRIGGPYPTSAPGGLEVLKAVAGTDPFSLERLYGTRPTCQTKGSRGGFGDEVADPPVVGWTTDEHRTVFLETPARRP